MLISKRTKRAAKEKITPRFYFLSFIFMVFAPLAQALGGSNGGGGYSVKCLDGKFYAMDYVATQKEISGIDAELMKAKASTEILKRIEKKLEDVAPELAASLNDFLFMNDKEANTATSRLWTDGVHPLEKLTDAQRTRDLSSCLGTKMDAEVFQAVIRRQFDGGVVYNRDPRQLSNLDATGPLQVSFTYAHEWLRDFTGDANIIMEVNYFIHSADFFKMNASQFATVMRRHGLDHLPGFAGMQVAKVSPLAAIKVSWDGVMYHHIDGKIGLSIYICPQPIRVLLKTGMDDADQLPDMSACRQVIHVKAQSMPELSWYQTFVFTPARAFQMKPFTTFVQGAEINSVLENSNRADEVGGPYLTMMLEIGDGPGAMRGVENYALGSENTLNALRAESCGTTSGGYCEKGIRIYLKKTVRVGDHGTGPGYFTYVNLALVNLIAQ